MIRALLNVLLSGCGSLGCVHTMFMNYLLAHPFLILSSFPVIIWRVSIHRGTLLAIRLDILLIVMNICHTFLGMKMWNIYLFVTGSTIIMGILDPSSHRTRLSCLVIRPVWRLMACTRPLSHSHFLSTILLMLIVITIRGRHIHRYGTNPLKRRVRPLLVKDPRRWWRQIRLMVILHL